MRTFTPETVDTALNAYDDARVTAAITGSVGATHIVVRDGKEVRATWRRRDESATAKHVAQEARR